MILSLLLTGYLGKRFTKPIYKLIKFSKDIGAKRYDDPIDLKTGDEFEILGSTFTGELKITAQVAVNMFKIIEESVLNPEPSLDGLGL